MPGLPFSSAISNSFFMGIQAVKAATRKQAWLRPPAASGPPDVSGFAWCGSVSKVLRLLSGRCPKLPFRDRLMGRSSCSPTADAASRTSRTDIN